MKVNYSIYMLNNFFNKSMKIMSENFLDKLQKGKLLVTYPDYTERLFIGRQKGYEANIKLNNYKIFSKLTRKAATGLAESYMDGDFETKDLSKLLLFSRDNESDFLKNKKNFIVDYCVKFKHFLNENTKRKAKKILNIIMTWEINFMNIG